MLKLAIVNLILVYGSMLIGVEAFANNESNQSQSNQIQVLASNKSTWVNFDWNNPVQERLFKANGLELSNATTSSGTKILKKGNIQIRDVYSEISFTEKKDSKNRSQYKFLIYNKGFCDQLESWAQEAFGVPANKIDASYVILGNAKAVDRIYQWNLGNKTVATLECAGLLSDDAAKDGKTAQISMLTFSDPQDQKRLTPLIYLNCKIRPKENQKSSAKTEETSIEFVINEFNGKVMNKKFEPVANGVEITSSLIKFNFLGSKNRIVKTEINRSNGSYTGLIEHLQSTQEKLNLTGQCDAIKQTQMF